jgi:transposase
MKLTIIRHRFSEHIYVSEIKSSEKLSPADRRRLDELLSKGKSSARELARARVIDMLDRGHSPAIIADLMKMGLATVYNIKNRFAADGFDSLRDRPRTGRPTVIGKDVRQAIRELAKSDPPEGRSRWTLRLLSSEAAARGIVPSISHNEVNRIIKSND